MESKDVAKGAVTTDRLAPVWSVALQCEFPPPAALDHLDVTDRSKEAIDIWVGAP